MSEPAPAAPLLAEPEVAPVSEFCGPAGCVAAPKKGFVTIPEPRVLLTVLGGLGMLAAMQRFRFLR